MVTPSFYHRFVDDTITSQRGLATAEDFLDTLNNWHESLKFKVDSKLPFFGMEAIRKEHLHDSGRVRGGGWSVHVDFCIKMVFFSDGFHTKKGQLAVNFAFYSEI